MSTDRAILIGSGIIALSIIGSAYVSGSWPIVVVTLLLVLVTYVHARIMKRVEWFTGAMERHSDQMRQIMAKDANIEMYWWDKTETDAGEGFPFEGAHNEKHELEKIYIGVPLHKRKKQTPSWKRGLLGTP